MKIVFMGTPLFGVRVLERLVEKYDVCLVVSQPDRVKKKGQFVPTPVKELALKLGIPVFQPEKIGLDYEVIKEVNADVLVTAAYGQYIPSKILKLFKKTINVHGSLLPLHRGGAPIQRSIINGDLETGVTIMEMAKRLDAGKMYAKRSYKILDDDTNTSVFEKLSNIGADLLMENIEDIYNEVNLGVVQDENMATYSPNLDPSEELIDFNKSAFLVMRQINGLSNEPGAYFIFNDVKVKVFKASVIQYEGNELPGTVISLKKKVWIKTLDNAVSLDILLLPGKKASKAIDFVNGQKLLKENDVI